jgi:hypothetical protein
MAGRNSLCRKMTESTLARIETGILLVRRKGDSIRPRHMVAICVSSCSNCNKHVSLQFNEKLSAKPEMNLETFLLVSMLPMPVFSVWFHF